MMSHNKFNKTKPAIAVILAMFIAVSCLLSGCNKEPVDPYEGLVCMHGVEISSVVNHQGSVIENTHICDQMDVLTSQDKYHRTCQFEEIELLELTDERIQQIQQFIEAIERCEEDALVYELSANGIDDWQEFEADVMTYCADFYPLDCDLEQSFADEWHRRPDGSLFIELDIARCKRAIEYCREEKSRVSITRAAIKEYVSQMDLNGYKVHDLKVIHDFICKNTEYDWTLKNRWAHSFVFDDSVQCSGYAEIYKMICNYVGLDVKYVSGLFGTERHAWNCVEIDGATYYIDLTYDDAEEDNIIYDYFLTSEPNGEICEIR